MIRPRTLARQPAALARQARRIVPTNAEETIRRLTVRWGQATSGLRMSPGLIIAGAQRSGTTTLYRMLADHPSVVKPLFHKGIGYFDLGYQHGWPWYQGHFPIARLAALRTRASGPPLTFDSSGYYMFHPLAPERIAAQLPQARVVVLLRDPVARAQSAHKHELARGFETEPFEAAIGLEEQRLAGQADRLRREPGYQSFSHRHHAYLARGRYAEQIEVLRAAVGPDRVYPIDANRLFADPLTEYARLLAWLGLPAWQPAEVPHLNARPGPALPSDLHRRLTDYFEASDAALVPLLEAVPSWRR